MWGSISFLNETFSGGLKAGIATCMPPPSPPPLTPLVILVGDVAHVSPRTCLSSFGSKGFHDRTVPWSLPAARRVPSSLVPFACPRLFQECPDVYFAGNQPTFATSVLRGEGGHKVRCRGSPQQDLLEILIARFLLGSFLSWRQRVSRSSSDVLEEASSPETFVGGVAERALWFCPPPRPRPRGSGVNRSLRWPAGLPRARGRCGQVTQPSARRPLGEELGVRLESHRGDLVADAVLFSS